MIFLKGLIWNKKEKKHILFAILHICLSEIEWNLKNKNDKLKIMFEKY